MKAMIFAAGMGTRLKPMTDSMPKALVPVGNEPLLLITLRRLIEAGATDITINVHHFADMIDAYLKTLNFEGVKIQTSDERKELLETGGALKHAKQILCDNTSKQPILIHNVDILSNVDLSKFYSQALQNDATLLVSWRKTKRYLLFNDDMRLVGWTNIETGKVRSPFDNLNVDECKKFAFSGIHVIGQNLINEMDSWPDKFAIMDFYLNQCAKANIRGIVDNNLRLLDVGKQDTIIEAEAFLKELNS